MALKTYMERCYMSITKNFWNIVQKMLPNANVVTLVKSPVIVIHVILPNYLTQDAYLIWNEKA